MTNTYAVKAVKTFRGHDGYGYNCSLTRNGKKVADVLDDNWGGGLRIDWVDARTGNEVEYTTRNYKDEIVTQKGSPEEALFETFIFGLPQIDGCEKGSKMYTNGDIEIDRLVNDFETAKKIKAELKKKVVAVIDSSVMCFSVKAPHTLQTVSDYVTKKYPQSQVLNSLNIEDVVKIYEAHNLIGMR